MLTQQQERLNRLTAAKKNVIPGPKLLYRIKAYIERRVRLYVVYFGSSDRAAQRGKNQTPALISQ